MRTAESNLKKLVRLKQLNYSKIICILACIAINFLGNKLAGTFSSRLPLFLDTIGTILAACLCGFLPGIIVGFFSNVLISLGDPISLYYGVLSVLIAVFAVIFARRKAFSSIKYSILVVFVFAFIGGGIGSLLTWLLYGFSVGDGISATFTNFLIRQGIGNFWSQLIADFSIDVLDKAISVTVVYLLLRFLPKKFLLRFEYGYLFVDENENKELGKLVILARELKNNIRKRNKSSLRQKVTWFIVCIASLLSITAISIGYYFYNSSIKKIYSDFCDGTVQLMLNDIDGDKIETYLSTGVKDEAYEKTMESFNEIRDSNELIKFMYVYAIGETCCYAVFDIDYYDKNGDDADVLGCELGEEVPFDDEFKKLLPKLWAGEEIPAVISDGTYGYLLSSYKAVFNSEGKCVAYAAADMDMDILISMRMIYIIRLASLLFGCTTVLLAFALMYAEVKIVTPINNIADTADGFVFNNIKDVEIASERMKALDIHTGDEIQGVYEAITQTISDIGAYVKKADDAAKTIAKMQDNVIYTFANLAECRDENTGLHIRRTAIYVREIAKELQRENKYTDIINDRYINDIFKSAPLHDIGKIAIPDAILNKPGRLTGEEFSVMKTHTDQGKSILEGVKSNTVGDSYLNEAVELAYYHHEKWDGSGYPCGLKGEDIPLSARIMAVADVYDALISKRCYKAAMSEEEALQIIKDSSGTHFDPSIVHAFLNIDLLAIDKSLEKYIA